MNAPYTQTGGARLGAFNATWPFAKLSVDRESLGLSIFGKGYVFPKDRIIKLSRHRVLFSAGLRIEHSVSDAPRFVVFWASIFFWTKGFQNLRDSLQSLGYSVV